MDRKLRISTPLGRVWKAIAQAPSGREERKLYPPVDMVSCQLRSSAVMPAQQPLSGSCNFRFCPQSKTPVDGCPRVPQISRTPPSATHWRELYRVLPPKAVIVDTAVDLNLREYQSAGITLQETVR